MTMTRAQLVNRAWGIVVKAGEGETPSSDDFNKIDTIVPAALAQLAAERVVASVNPDGIDEAIFLPLARYLANEASVDFSQPYSEETRLSAQTQIRRVLAVADFAQPLAVDYF